MKILITGNDTDIGKTVVAKFLIQSFLKKGISVQYCKPIQCGLSDEGEMDEDLTKTKDPLFQSKTLLYFEQPIAPLDAAANKNYNIDLNFMFEVINQFTADVKIFEGSGGIAVPIDSSNRDWADLANLWSIDFTVLVIENRLGSINQARLTGEYAWQRGLHSGFFLNTKKPINQLVEQSNLKALQNQNIPLWAILGYQQEKLIMSNFPWN